jgi:hypothetical protein
MRRGKPITQYGADGNFLRSFDSRTEAASWLRDHGHPKAKVGGLSRLTDGIIYGFRWRDGRHGGSVPADDGHAYRRVILRFTDGHLDGRFDSLADAARDLVAHGHPKAVSATIGNVAQVPLRRAFGHQWRYEDEWDGKDLATYGPRKHRARNKSAYVHKKVDARKKPVIGTDAKGVVMSFESASAAARHLRGHGHPKAYSHRIGEAAQGRAPTAYGWTWRYGHGEKGSSTSNGESNSHLWLQWNHTRRKCRSPKDAAWGRYGGRGIRVDPTWEDYMTFHEWSLAHGYKDGLTLDRKDRDGDFTPDNAIWVKPGEGYTYVAPGLQKAVIQISDGVEVNRYRSVQRAAESLIAAGSGAKSGDRTTTMSNIVCCLKGRTRSAYGFYWKYVAEDDIKAAGDPSSQ